MDNGLKQGKPWVPRYAAVPLLLCVVVNTIIYNGAEAVTGGWKHYNLTLAADRAIPLIPGFVVVYLGCYVFWVVNYILITRRSEEGCYRFVAADLLSKVLCGVFFLVMPTTNVRPQLLGDGWCTGLLRLLYSIDTPTRLFPSIHCLVSWLCFAGIRGRRDIPVWYRRFSFVMAFTVCLSTLVTKQHGVADVLGGVGLAEGSFWLAYHTELYRMPARLCVWLGGKAGGRRWLHDR